MGKDRLGNLAVCIYLNLYLIVVFGSIVDNGFYPGIRKDIGIGKPVYGNQSVKLLYI